MCQHNLREAPDLWHKKGDTSRAHGSQPLTPCSWLIATIAGIRPVRQWTNHTSSRFTNTRRTTAKYSVNRCLRRTHHCTLLGRQGRYAGGSTFLSSAARASPCLPPLHPTFRPHTCCQNVAHAALCSHHHSSAHRPGSKVCHSPAHAWSQKGFPGSAANIGPPARRHSTAAGTRQQCCTSHPQTQPYP